MYLVPIASSLSSKTVERHGGLAFGVQLRAWTASGLLTRKSAASASTVRAICSLSKPDFSADSSVCLAASASWEALA
jgi:hypothetical protein